MYGSENKARELAAAVSERGGRAFYVGGCVRDRLMGKACEDLDIEVYGLSRDDLMSVLEGFGRVDSPGMEYGIFTLADCGLDVALPRTEVCTGKGHRDFIVTVDPLLAPERACRRRDFTVNAILSDVLTDELVDPYGGASDLEGRVIRHIASDTFVEDPLRVLRACQFASRFGFSVAPETVGLCRGMDISTLPPARVMGEMKKALLLSQQPSMFFGVLKDMDHLGFWFPELAGLEGVAQDPRHHPEGDVWIHTMQVLDRAAVVRGRTENPLGFMLLAMLHDVGKTVTTEVVNGAIHSYGHETEGLPLAEAFLGRMDVDRSLTAYVLGMITLHMLPNVIIDRCSSVKAANSMFDRAPSPVDLILFSTVDKNLGPEEAADRENQLRERYGVYREMMSMPYVTGKDLVEAGIKPSGEFARLLGTAHRMRLAGVKKENALKHILSQNKHLIQ